MQVKTAGGNIITIPVLRGPEQKLLRLFPFEPAATPISREMPGLIPWTSTDSTTK